MLLLLLLLLLVLGVGIGGVEEWLNGLGLLAIATVQPRCKMMGDTGAEGERRLQSASRSVWYEEAIEGFKDRFAA